MILSMKKNVACLFLPLIAMAGCDKTESARMTIEPVSVSHQLVKMNSCEEYVAYAKETAKQRMRAETTRNCQNMWDEAEHMRDYSNDERMFDGAPESSGDIAGNDSESAADNSSNKGDYSQTNTQEVGVDEADLVKTDGEHIYVISGSDLVIVSIGDDGALSEVGRIEVEGRPEELFLYNGHAVVFTALGKDNVPEALYLPSAPISPEATATEATDKDVDARVPANDEMYYDYSVGDYTGIATIDLSDKTAPILVRNVQYAGRYVSSRRIDGAVRAVIGTPMNALDVDTWPDVDYWEMSELKAKQAINTACEALIEANEEYIDGLTIENLLPSKYDAEDDQVDAIAECSDIMGPKTPAGTGLLTVVSLDLDTPTEAQHEVTIMGEEGHVYASQSALYLTTARDYVIAAWESGLWDEETSGIHKFDIASDPKQALYLGSGSVKGRLLDQFSMGEHEGYLRLATTTGGIMWGRSEAEMTNTLDNHIIILKEENGALQTAGELSGIGSEEEIYAARFIGDRGFVVTYLQIDPLFTFDLSDPTDPKKVGEWVGPGYSTYLHPYGEDRIIAMGQEDWVTTVSLYDLSDYAHPELLKREPLQNEIQTAALYEHRAFTFNPETGKLFLPFYDWDVNTGILIFDISDSDIELTGTLNMADELINEGPTRRAMYKGDALIAVGACRLTSTELADPSTIISTLAISGDSCEMPRWYY